MIIIIKRCKNNAEPSQEESILFGRPGRSVLYTPWWISVRRMK